ncbi:hypothetical protein FHS14_001807 [Paenibacillus baekrokdamisoli]|nr:hypothetical protein [Paenibacillus baekrokdamisoli]
MNDQWHELSAPWITWQSQIEHVNLIYCKILKPAANRSRLSHLVTFGDFFLEITVKRSLRPIMR